MKPHTRVDLIRGVGAEIKTDDSLDMGPRASFPTNTLTSRYEQIICLTEPSEFVTTRQSLVPPGVPAGAVAQLASTITSVKR